MSEEHHASVDGPPQSEQYVWYHVIVTTYGAWLDGDARGFRTRHHREHIEGDYKNPPPLERYADRRRHSQESLKQPPVFLEEAWRPIIGQALVGRFQQLGGFVLCAAMAQQHGHLLVKIPRGLARAWAGLAKKHAWFVARAGGWQGKLWAIRSKAVDVRDREHQRNVYHYVLDHEEEGAWVWKWRPPPRSTSPGVATPGLRGESLVAGTSSPGVATPGLVAP
jgi:hypothetical protein